MDFAKPLIVISKCLEFDACRYNGASINDKIVRSLKKHVQFIPVCPEVEIGLGTPRDPIRLVKKDDEIDNVAAGESAEQPADLSNAMAAYSAAISKTKDIKLSK